MIKDVFQISQGCPLFACVAHFVKLTHYKIRTLDNSGFYISPRITFSNLQELVSHYKSECPLLDTTEHDCSCSTAAHKGCECDDSKQC
ncbi:hypothetical protein AAFF_G00101350 [Aldrovandia affinis]|uniref:SH2 domain-containing protein n=1 Tax=Aldrovandia affinis TaxID=143900 RepID=A0AAD7RV22_9TELE|nr:hypothetical protein AAFF_G00101350 [Aldrovandia affinis]